MSSEFAAEPAEAGTFLLQETALYEATRSPETSAVSNVLRATIDLTRARYGVVLQKERTRARNLYGQRDDGTTIGRPDKLLCPDQVADALRSGASSLRLDRPRAGMWSLVLPVLSSRANRVLLILGGSTPPGPTLARRLAAVDAERWASCLGTAVYVDRLKDQVRGLKERLARDRTEHRTASALDGTAGPSGGASGDAEGDGLVLEGGAPPVRVPEIIGDSDPVQKVLQTIAVVSRFDLPVLIEGESGTGKELVARAIHRLSERRDYNFVSENCGAIPSNLVEAELFGSVAGAFTGATESRPGIFEVAHRGTVFLDEVGEMDLDTQKKLLRVLQEHEIRRVGSQTPQRVDFRVISATNRVLEDQVKQGRFRKDLYYRLNVATIFLPPLRERPEDLPLLVEHFNESACRGYDRKPLDFSGDALERLTTYTWPGNVRELQNEILRLACTGRTRIRPCHLSERILRETSPSPGQRLIKEEPFLGLEEIESRLMAPVFTEAIRNASGNVAEAARRLKITRASLYRRLRRYGIRAPSPELSGH